MVVQNVLKKLCESNYSIAKQQTQLKQHDGQNSSAKKTDSRPSLRVCDVVWGPSSLSLSYVPVFNNIIIIIVVIID